MTFIDTGFHFPETIETMLAIVERHRPRLRVIAPWRHLVGVGAEGFCCSDHKVEQLDHALADRRAWLSGIRRADGPSRAQARQVEIDRRGPDQDQPASSRGPMPTWRPTNDAMTSSSTRSVRRGFASIGCRPVHVTGSRRRRPQGRPVVRVGQDRVRVAPVSGHEAPAAPAALAIVPVGLRVEGRRIVVVGAGRIAARKAAAYVEQGALVTVVAPDHGPAMERSRRRCPRPTPLRARGPR